jgi:hypothetical protein
MLCGRGHKRLMRICLSLNIENQNTIKLETLSSLIVTQYTLNFDDEC